MPVGLQIESCRRQLDRSADDILRFARRARSAAGLQGTVSILVQSSERMQAMNRYFRHQDKPTDVLSFPAAAALQGMHEGDIAISADIAADNAHAFGHSLVKEIKVLILHGMLHLAGYDHETDSGQMAREERRLRVALRLPLSLIERTETAPGGRTPVSAASRRKPAKIKLRRASGSRPKRRTAKRPR
jgi:probable rRNA maturation factor